MNWYSILKNTVILLLISTIIAYILAWMIRIILATSGFNPLNPVNLNYPSYTVIMGLIICIPAAILIISGNYQLLAKSKVSLENREPFHIPESLAVTGIYAHTRNPIYLGVLIGLVGFGLFTQYSLFLFLVLPVFILFRYSFIRWEESNLEEEFGDLYLEYKKSVRRWF
ncbi:MAG: isoprenylcysteine carboxylmethyltransferase family protein [Candidatus Heimdallarchaeota archaeon]|nr:isoprenylcysteine carboxylmethyltransferase family protein [Candidatus Heimdallarchaeota archaeon]